MILYERPICFGPLSLSRNCRRGMAGKVIMLTVPREPRSTERCATVSLSGASMMLIKSYCPNSAYCETILQPNSSISLFTSSRRSGFLCRVCRPSEVNVLNKTYVGMACSFRRLDEHFPSVTGPEDRQYNVAPTTGFARVRCTVRGDYISVKQSNGHLNHMRSIKLRDKHMFLLHSSTPLHPAARGAGHARGGPRYAHRRR